MNRILDRKVQYDEKSKNFPIRELIKADKPKTKSWTCDKWLDQGQEGACVGFGWSHDLIAKPHNDEDVDQAYAEKVYQLAQTLDGTKGTHEGSTVLAGAKAVQQLGRISSYRWAFGLDDVLLSLSEHGPVVLGIDWYNDMFTPDSKGFVKPTGGVAGGHCIIARGVNVRSKYVTLRNSWGKDWGKNGDCKVSFDDLATLLKNDGEACIPIKI